MTKTFAALALILASFAFAGCAAEEETDETEEQGSTESQMSNYRQASQEQGQQTDARQNQSVKAQPRVPAEDKATKKKIQDIAKRTTK